MARHGRVPNNAPAEEPGGPGGPGPAVIAASPPAPAGGCAAAPEAAAPCAGRGEPGAAFAAAVGAAAAAVAGSSAAVVAAALSMNGEARCCMPCGSSSGCAAPALHEEAAPSRCSSAPAEERPGLRQPNSPSPPPPPRARGSDGGGICRGVAAVAVPKEHELTRGSLRSLPLPCAPREEEGHSTGRGHTPPGQTRSMRRVQGLQERVAKAREKEKEKDNLPLGR